ncbi:hypothetical protein H8A95_15750 [Bradyrhizobium sp. Pear76]|uniref:hypothetical protein n=1 Tax=Bradyrhizobium oropedii TaxID=1571201 RepID=UPI001E65AB6D|nr:hypothetical protein [Bradyrhizobium oropedii]MCC8963724.1 hypothetical protein [Bradyrhizobium oropedii]
MGEIAEMMLEGILCEGCGELIDEDGVGHPQRCSSCDMSPRTLRSVKRVVGRERQAERHNRERRAAARLRKPFECHCGKLCRTERGLEAHKRDKHGAGGW